MATRATITLKKWECREHYYNHWDWYPTWLWMELIKLFEDKLQRHCNSALAIQYMSKELPKKYENIEADDVKNIWDEYHYTIEIVETVTDWKVSRDTVKILCENLETNNISKIYEAKLADKHTSEYYMTEILVNNNL